MWHGPGCADDDYHAPPEPLPAPTVVTVDGRILAAVRAGDAGFVATLDAIETGWDFTPGSPIKSLMALELGMAKTPEEKAGAWIDLASFPLTAFSGPGASTYRVASSRLLGTARENLLRAVTNRRLRSTINELYRPGARIGSGSSMVAARAEGTHVVKLLERRTNLLDILRTETLSPTDQRIGLLLLIDIQNALSAVIAR